MSENRDNRGANRIICESEKGVTEIESKPVPVGGMLLFAIPVTRRLVPAWKSGKETSRVRNSAVRCVASV